MAIPLSNEQKVVQAPQTANLQPMDNQQLLGAMGDAALATNRQMQETIQGSFKFADKIRLQNDALKRNKAEREYNERTAQLNEELEEKQGEDRQKFQPKYEAEMKLASDKYEAAINRVSDFEIREGSKRSISAWNTRNASNYQYENYQNETFLQEKEMGQALVSDNRKRVLSITPADTPESLYAYATDQNLGFSHGAQMIRQFYGGRMGMPEDVVEQYVNDYVTKGYLAMANRLVQVTKEYTGNAAYTPAIEFLNQGINAGLINPEEAIAAKRDLQKERLALNVAHNPSWFIGADGKFNPAGRGKFAPDLTQYEYEYYLKQSLGGYKPGQSGSAAIVTMAYRSEYDRWMKDWLADHGMFDDDSIEEYIKQKALTGKVLTKEEALKELQANVPEEKKSPTELANLSNMLSKMQSQWLLIDNQKGFAVGKSTDIPGTENAAGTASAKTMSLEEMQAEFAKDPNRYTLFQPLADYQPLAEDRANTENNFRIMWSALKKEALFRDPGKAVKRKDEEGYYRTNNQERGMAILSYLDDTIPMTSSQILQVTDRFTTLLPQKTKTGNVTDTEEEWVSGLDPYGFVSDDDETSRQVIIDKLFTSMKGVLTNQQIQKAKQALDSRPITQYIWTPSRDMENAAYVQPKLNAWVAPMMGAATATWAKNQAQAAAIGQRYEGYQTEHKKLYNKTYQAQNATKSWAKKQVEENAKNGGLTAEQIRAAAAKLDSDRKQANRRKK